MWRRQRPCGRCSRPTLDHALNLHILEALRTVAIGQAELAAGTTPGAQEITACFADLVGFTRLGEQLPAEELGHVTGRLAALAREVVSSPVRLVKMIGDAAMLVSPAPEAALAAALELVEAAEGEGEDFPVLRAGVASRPALSRARRLVRAGPSTSPAGSPAIARPGERPRDRGRQRRAAEAFAYSFAGERRLKGIKGKVQPVPRPPGERQS